MRLFVFEIQLLPPSTTPHPPPFLLLPVDALGGSAALPCTRTATPPHTPRVIGDRRVPGCENIPLSWCKKGKKTPNPKPPHKPN